MEESAECVAGNRDVQDSLHGSEDLDSSSSENSGYDVSTSYDVTEEIRKDEEDSNVEAKPRKEDCGSTGLCVRSLKFL